MNNGFGHFIIAYYKEPQNVGGQMLPIEIFYINTNAERFAIEYAEKLKELPYVEKAFVTKVLHELK